MPTTISSPPVEVLENIFRHVMAGTRFYEQDDELVFSRVAKIIQFWPGSRIYYSPYEIFNAASMCQPWRDIIAEMIFEI